MRKRTSSGERDQFSVEKAYAEIALHADLDRTLDDVEQRVLALLVPGGAGQSALPGPSDRCRP